MSTRLTVKNDVTGSTNMAMFSRCSSVNAYGYGSTSFVCTSPRNMFATKERLGRAASFAASLADSSELASRAELVARHLRKCAFN